MQKAVRKAEVKASFDKYGPMICSWSIIKQNGCGQIKI